MAARHRIPTIFNLSMVDVLCCALGCVILLWLLNLREARQRAEAAGQTSDQLTQTRSHLVETEGRLRTAEQRAEALAAQLRQTTGERDVASRRAETLDKDLAALRD